MPYILKVGLWKTLKNTAITFGVPAVLFILNSAVDFIEPETFLKISPIIAFISYFVKNWIANRNKKIEVEPINSTPTTT